MSESAEQPRDDERERATSVEEAPDWNTPASEAAPDSPIADLSVAVRRVLAVDQHLSQRRVRYGPDEDEEEDEG